MPRQQSRISASSLSTKKIIAIPSDVLPDHHGNAAVRAFRHVRIYGYAGSLRDTSAKEAFYYVTPPEKDWTRAHKEEHLRLFNKPVMDIITIHEAYPGHYTQFLYAKAVPFEDPQAAF